MKTRRAVLSVEDLVFENSAILVYLNKEGASAQNPCEDRDWNSRFGTGCLMQSDKLSVPQK
jgi:hypothetical protein